MTAVIAIAFDRLALGCSRPSAYHRSRVRRRTPSCAAGGGGAGGAVSFSRTSSASERARLDPLGEQLQGGGHHPRGGALVLGAFAAHGIKGLGLAHHVQPPLRRRTPSRLRSPSRAAISAW